MLGTPAFMAPEQARGADVDERADIYAVGATMYQALTGKLPYEAPSIPALLFSIVEKTPTPLLELRPDLPRELVAVVERAMAKDRDARFADADAMRRALSPWSGLPASVPSPISATAATVSSGKIPPHDPATPIIVKHTPAPSTTTKPEASTAAPATERARTSPLVFLTILGGMAAVVVIVVWIQHAGKSQAVAALSASPMTPSAVTSTIATTSTVTSALAPAVHAHASVTTSASTCPRRASATARLATGKRSATRWAFPRRVHERLGESL